MRGNYKSPSELLQAQRETGKSYWDLVGKPLTPNTGYNLNNPHAAEESEYNKWYNGSKLSDEDSEKLQQFLEEYDKDIKSNYNSLPSYKGGKDKFHAFAAKMGPRVYKELHRQGRYTPYVYDNMMRQLAWESNYGTSLNAINNHNYAGIRANPTKYVSYKNEDEFVKSYVTLLNKRYPNAMTAKSAKQFAKALKANGYYEDSLEHYSNSLAAMSSISNAVRTHMHANPSQYEVEVLLDDLKKQDEQPAVSTRVVKPINREPINKEPFVNTPIPTQATLITRPEYLESNSLIKKSFEQNMDNMLQGKEFQFNLPGFRGGKDSGIKEYASNEDMHINPDGSITTRNGNTGSVILPDVNVYAQKDYNSAFDYSGANDVMGTIADFTPVVGDVKQGLEAANDLRKGKYTEAAIGAGLLLLPNVLEKPTKYAGKKAFNFLSDITPKQWTAAQDAAIAKGDMAEALRLRNLHAEVKGYSPIHEYHGSNKSFKEFKESPYGIYFTPDESAAEGYVRGSSPTKYDVYLNSGDDVITINNDGLPWNKIPETKAANAFGISKEDLHSIVGKYNAGAQPWYYDYLYPFGFKPKTNYYAVDQLAKAAKQQGKASLKLVNAMDNGKKITAKNRLYDQHIVFKPNQVKSADAVTYDDNGIRIPLGKRDNFSINDIRYGLLPFVAGLTGYGLLNNHKAHRGSTRKGNTKK